MKKIILDIETAPDLEAVERFSEPFDPSSVKTGNLGPEKAEAKIEAARESYEDELIEKAALRPHTATIVAIGLHDEDSQNATLLGVDQGMDEREILLAFWQIWNVQAQSSAEFVYYGGSERGNSFDPRMIVNRSWIHCPDAVPFGLIGKWGFKSFVDLAPIFLAGGFGEFCSANNCAKRLGLIGKECSLGVGRDKDDLEADGVSGMSFHTVLKKDRELAANYLRNDLILERLIQQTIYPS